MTLSQTLTNYTTNYGNTLLKLNVNTKLPLITNDFRLRNSRLVATPTSRLNSSIQHNLPRSFPINSLDHTKSLHNPEPILSLSDSQKVYVLYTQFSMSQCWNQQLPMQF